MANQEKVILSLSEGYLHKVGASITPEVQEAVDQFYSFHPQQIDIDLTEELIEKFRTANSLNQDAFIEPFNSPGFRTRDLIIINRTLSDGTRISLYTRADGSLPKDDSRVVPAGGAGWLA